VKEAKLQGASRIIGVDNKASKADEGMMVTLNFNFTLKICSRSYQSGHLLVSASLQPLMNLTCDF
jgi:hypothetical protein